MGNLLWTDGEIRVEVLKRIFSADDYGLVLDPDDAIYLLKKIRDEYAKRIKELEARVAYLENRPNA